MMGAIRQLPQHHPEQVEAEDDVGNEFDVDMRRDLASGHGSPENVEAEGLKGKDRGRVPAQLVVRFKAATGQ